MSRHGDHRGRQHAPQPEAAPTAPAVSPGEPAPVAPTLDAIDAPALAPPVAPLAPAQAEDLAPPDPLPPPPAPLRKLAICEIHAGRIYHRGDEIPPPVAAQLVEGEHWHLVT